MIESNVSLKNFNTFGIDVSCKLFSQAENEDHVRNVIQSNAFKTIDSCPLVKGSKDPGKKTLFINLFFFQKN